MDEQSNQVLHEIHTELKLLTQKLESAFAKDESGEPDYSGHKQFHINQVTVEKENRDSKNHLFKEVLTWIVIGLLSAIATILLHGTNVPLIK